jgi:hypothetical protein
MGQNLHHPLTFIFGLLLGHPAHATSSRQPSTWRTLQLHTSSGWRVGLWGLVCCGNHTRLLLTFCCLSGSNAEGCPLLLCFLLGALWLCLLCSSALTFICVWGLAPGVTAACACGFCRCLQHPLKPALLLRCAHGCPAPQRFPPSHTRCAPPASCALQVPSGCCAISHAGTGDSELTAPPGPCSCSSRLRAWSTLHQEQGACRNACGQHA